MDDYLVGIGMLMVQKRVNDCKKQPTITSKADPEATKVPLLDAIISNVCQFPKLISIRVKLYIL